MQFVLGFLLYYGSAILPLSYLLVTRFRGLKRRAVLFTMGWHFLASCGVSAFAFWCWSAGYREWYWANAWNIPVNLLFAVVYLAILLI